MVVIIINAGSAIALPAFLNQAQTPKPLSSLEGKQYIVQSTRVKGRLTTQRILNLGLRLPIWVSASKLQPLTMTTL